MRILFRVDCERSIGTGHLFRCREIGRYCKSNGWDVEFLVNDHWFSEEVVKEFLYYKLTFEGIIQEIAETRKSLFGKTFDFIVVDFYAKAENDELMDVFAEHARWGVWAITDDFNRVNIRADFLLACHPQQSRYKYDIIHQKVLLGEKYCIVGREFVTNHIIVNKKVENVLVSFGGHDPGNVNCAVVKHLRAAGKDLAGVTFRFLLGGIYRHEEELRVLLEGVDFKWEFYKNLPTVLPLFLRSDMAITAAGNTLCELYHLNVPSVVIGLNDRQHGEGLCLQEKGLIKYAGYYTHVESGSFNKLFLGVLNSYDERCGLHDRCRAYFNIDPLQEVYSIMKGVEDENKR